MRILPAFEFLPKWLKYLINILLVLTVVYLIIKISALLIEGFRKLMYFLFEKHTFYVCLLAVVIGLVAFIVIAEINGMPIIENRIQDIKNLISHVREAIANKISA